MRHRLRGEVGKLGPRLAGTPFPSSFPVRRIEEAPGSTRPTVFADSCLSGRPPAGPRKGTPAIVTRRELTGRIALGAGLATLSPLARAAPAAPLSVDGDIAFAPPPPDIWSGHGTVARAGGVLHYAVLGAPTKAPPVVLLHKLGGWIADWRGVAPALAAERQVIAFDLPGHGQSTWLGDPPQVQGVLETAMLVQGALAQLQRQMGFERVHLAGTSLGGCVAAALAALCPQMVARLALPSCVLGKASSWEAVMTKEAGQGALFTPQGDPKPSPAALSKAAFHLDHAETIAAEQNTSRKIAGRWIRPHERGVALTDFTALLPRIEAPTLLLYGARDSYFLKFRESALALLREGHAIVLPDASGFPVQDQPEATGTALATFLRG